MNTLNKNTSINFSWNWSTHQKITSEIAEKVNTHLPPSAKFNVKSLTHYSTEPDVWLRYPNHLPSEHFADINEKKPKDALHFFNLYTQEAKKAYLNSKSDPSSIADVWHYLGISIHFLQDMMNPFHVVFEKLSKYDSKMAVHRRFEALAETIQDEKLPQIEAELLKKKKPYENISQDNFLDKVLYPDMIRTRKLYEQINYNDHNYPDIATKALKNTYRVTKSYLEMMGELFSQIDMQTPIKMPQHIPVIRNKNKKK